MFEYRFIHNTDQQRFELHLPDDSVALIAYRVLDDDTLSLYHTEVPFRHEGKGIGAQLAENTMKACKAEGKKIVPLCSFVAAYIRRNPEWQEIVRK